MLLAGRNDRRRPAFLDLIRVASLSAATAAFAPASAIAQRQRRTHCVHPAFAAAFGARASSKFLRDARGKTGQTGAAKFTPRGTTHVFVNVAVAPRYVARVQLGSGGLTNRSNVSRVLLCV